ncbi:hypothetical protein JCM10450v2_000017 [Rhodotorula kratochvilovae]
MARTRSFSCSPPASPPSLKDGPFARPSSTPRRRHSISTGSNPDVSNEAVRALSDVPDMAFGPPSTSVSSDFRPRTPLAPRKTAAVSTKSLAAAEEVSITMHACFQEVIRPIGYYDVPLPPSYGPPHGQVFHPAPFHPAYPGQYGFLQHAYAPHGPAYCDVPEYGPLPPTPPYSAHPFHQQHHGAAFVDPYSPAFPPPSSFGSGFPAPYGPVHGSGAPAPNAYGPPLFPAPFFSPPASPHTSDDDGCLGYAHVQQQQQGYYAPGLGLSFHPPPPTLRELLDEGEHFLSSGSCKFFDVAKGFGFIIDDNSEALGNDVFVHYTGIDMPRGFRCLAQDERVEYILTKHSSGRFQALSVTGENGAPLKGLTDDRAASLGGLVAPGPGPKARKPKVVAPSRPGVVSAIVRPARPHEMPHRGPGGRGGFGPQAAWRRHALATPMVR